MGRLFGFGIAALAVPIALTLAAGLASAASPVSPLNPITAPPSVRAGFFDFRVHHGVRGWVRGWHYGVDVVVNETRCSVAAPARGCRRVFALVAGRAWWTALGLGGCGFVRINRFGYGHVRVIVRRGQWVAAGQVIGWSCRGKWHVHISEFAVQPCRTPRRGLAAWPVCQCVDPRCAGHVLAPLRDTAGPALENWHLTGDGYLDAEIDDAVAPYWLAGAFARLANPLPPSKITVNGRLFLDASRRLNPPPGVVYAPEATRNLTAPFCGATPSLPSCAGHYIFRLGRFPPGDTVVVRAWDSVGNKTIYTITIPEP